MTKKTKNLPFTSDDIREWIKNEKHFIGTFKGMLNGYWSTKDIIKQISNFVEERDELQDVQVRINNNRDWLAQEQRLIDFEN